MTINDSLHLSSQMTVNANVNAYECYYKSLVKPNTCNIRAPIRATDAFLESVYI